MAQSWSGFRPQNELIKLYWEALELSRSEKYRFLKAFEPGRGKREKESSEEDPDSTALGFILLR